MRISQLNRAGQSKDGWLRGAIGPIGPWEERSTISWPIHPNARTHPAARTHARTSHPVLRPWICDVTVSPFPRREKENKEKLHLYINVTKTQISLLISITYTFVSTIRNLQFSKGFRNWHLLEYLIVYARKKKLHCCPL